MSEEESSVSSSKSSPSASEISETSSTSTPTDIRGEKKEEKPEEPAPEPEPEPKQDEEEPSKSSSSESSDKENDEPAVPVADLPKPPPPQPKAPTRKKMIIFPKKKNDVQLVQKFDDYTVNNPIQPQKPEGLPAESEIILDETDKWLVDHEISTTLESEALLQSFEWNAPLIAGINKKVNPISDNSAVLVANSENFKNSMAAKVFCVPCQNLTINPISEPQPKPHDELDITYLSEILKSRANFKTETADYDSTSIFFRGKSEKKLLFYPGNSDSFGTNQIDFHRLKFTKWSFDFGQLIEPIICTMYAFRQGRTISERWTFMPKESSDLLKEVYSYCSINNKGALELTDELPEKPMTTNYRAKRRDTYLVFEFRRPLLVDDGDKVNQYYLDPKNTKKRIIATKVINDSWPRTKNIYSTFAVTVLPMAAIDGHEQFHVPCPHLLTQPLTPDHLAMLIDMEDDKKRGKTIGIKISMGHMTVRGHNNTEPVKKGYAAIAALTQGGLTRSRQYANMIHFRLNTAAFTPPKKVKARNVFARISMLDRPGGEKLSLLYPPDGGFAAAKCTDTVMTNVFYHQEQPVFMDSFSAEIPYPLPKELCFHVEFFHGIAQKSEAAESYIGHSYVKIVNPDGTFADDTITAGISYDKEKPNGEATRGSFCTLSIRIRSSFYSSDRAVQRFLTGAAFGGFIDPSAIKEADTNSLLHHHLVILEEILQAVTTQPNAAFASLVELTNKLYPGMLQKFTDILNSFAYNFAFRHEKDYSMVATAMMRAYTEWLSKQQPEEGKEPDDQPLLEFLFTCIVKAIYISGDRRFMSAYEALVEAFIKHLLHQGPFVQTRRNPQLARFVNLLYDCKAYSAVGIALRVYSEAADDTPEQLHALMEFVELTVRPRIFFTCSYYLDEFRDCMLGIMKRAAVRADSEFLQRIFHIVLRMTSNYTKQMQSIIANRYVEALSEFAPLKMVPFANSPDFHAILIFYLNIVNFMTKETFDRWWPKAPRHEFFLSMHFLLTTIRLPHAGVDEKNAKRVRELTYCAHNTALHLLELIADQKDVEDVAESTELYYHLICLHKTTDVCIKMMDQLTAYVSDNIDACFLHSRPAFPRIMTRMILLSQIDSDRARNFIQAVFDADLKAHNNNNRALAVACRSLGTLTPQHILALKIKEESGDKKSPIFSIINNAIATERELKRTDLLDQNRAGLLWNRAYDLIPSPDAFVEQLNRLYEFYESKGTKFTDEMLQVRIVQAATILEYSCLLGRMKSIDGARSAHPAQIFSTVCPMIEEITVKNRISQDFPKIPSYCDSAAFSERSFINQIYDVLRRCMDSELYEIGYALIDVLWPLLESHRMFGSLYSMFKEQAKVCHAFKLRKEDAPRNFGTFFSVRAMGKVFETENGVTYIYKEACGTKLEDFAESVLKVNKEAHPDMEFELIFDTKKIDTKKLDPAKAFIQIVHLEPNFKNFEMERRLSVFEMNHDILKFSQDYEYVEDGGKPEEHPKKDRWITRQIFQGTKAMPSCRTREFVIDRNVRSVTFAPIRVAYRVLASQNREIHAAIEVKDFKVLRTLMTRTMLSVDDDAPLTIARNFIDTPATNDKDGKYTKKLVAAFKEFVAIGRRAVLEHAEYVSQHPAFIPIQNEFEASYQTVSDSILQIIDGK